MQIQVQSGAFDLNAPRITLGDMAHGLSQLCRYTGNCDVFWSVCHHILLCHQLAPVLKLPKNLHLPLLLHDGAEYILHDQNGVYKRNLGEWFLKKEKEIDTAIAKKFGFEVELFEHPEIQRIDKAALYIESKALFTNRPPELWAYIDKDFDAMNELRPIINLMRESKHNFMSMTEVEAEFKSLILTEIAS